MSSKAVAGEKKLFNAGMSSKVVVLLLAGMATVCAVVTRSCMTMGKVLSDGYAIYCALPRELREITAGGMQVAYRPPSASGLALTAVCKDAPSEVVIFAMSDQQMSGRYSSICIVNRRDGSLQSQIDVGRAYITGMDYGPTGRIVFSTARVGALDATLRVLNTRSGEVETLATGTEYDSPEWSSDGRWIAVSQKNGSEWLVRALSIEDPGRSVNIAVGFPKAVSEDGTVAYRDAKGRIWYRGGLTGNMTWKEMALPWYLRLASIDDMQFVPGTTSLVLSKYHVYNGYDLLLCVPPFRKTKKLAHWVPARQYSLAREFGHGDRAP